MTKIYKKNFGVEAVDIVNKKAVSIGQNWKWDYENDDFNKKIFTTVKGFDAKKAKKNLKEVAKFLDNLILPKKAKFNFQVIGEHPNNGHEPPEKNHCGTAACAIGWLGLKKKFGLDYKWDKKLFFSLDSNFVLSVFNENGEEGFDAVATQLGIAVEAVSWLFDPIHYYNEDRGDGYDFEVTKEAVSERVKYACDYGVYYV